MNLVAKHLPLISVRLECRPTLISSEFVGNRFILVSLFIFLSKHHP